MQLGFFLKGIGHGAWDIVDFGFRIADLKNSKFKIIHMLSSVICLLPSVLWLFCLYSVEKIC